MKVTDEVEAELKRACAAFPKFASAHEGYAVLLEEVDELWELVKVKQSKHDHAKMRAEAMQIAAMAIRFIVDVCAPTNEQLTLDEYVQLTKGR